MADLTTELLTQLQADAAAWWSPSRPYRLGIDGEQTILGDDEDDTATVLYVEGEGGASDGIATFHVDDMAEVAARLFAAAPALVADARKLAAIRALVQPDSGVTSSWLLVTRIKKVLNGDGT